MAYPQQKSIFRKMHSLQNPCKLDVYYNLPTLTGENFSTSQSQSVVSAKQIYGEVLTSSDTTEPCKVPKSKKNWTSLYSNESTQFQPENTEEQLIIIPVSYTHLTLPTIYSV